jgi:hypothetical protein
MAKIGTKTGILDVDEISINPAQEDGNLSKLVGFEIPAYDYIALTYVAEGNGVGEIETVVYKSGGSGGDTVATLTLVYNASNKISNITKT